MDNDKKLSYIDSQNNICKFKIEFLKNQKIIKRNFEFKEIIYLPEGDNMTKIIIDKYIKTNSELDKNIEINLSKEYEVLSENTSLYAEIINEKTQKSQLTQVNILSKKEKTHYRRINNYAFVPRISLGAARACRRYISSSSSSDNSDSENDSELSNKDLKEEELNEKGEEKRIEFDIDLTELIISQDPIEGFWNKNDDTMKVEQLLEKKIINNVNNICLKLKEKQKKFYTILIIYFLETYYKDKIDEYLLVLNKAKNYLKQSGIIYEEISSQIDNK